MKSEPEHTHLRVYHQDYRHWAPHSFSKLLGLGYDLIEMLDKPDVAGVYLCLKIRLVCEKGKQAFKAVKTCWTAGGSPYGMHLSMDTLAEEGQTAACPICQVKF